MDHRGISAELNDSNTTCPLSFLWNQSTIDSQRSILYICIVASIVHSMFWAQLIFYPALRKRSMQWLYAYLVTDILLLSRFFFLYIVHTKAYECISNFAWFSFVCYFEAIVDNYLNALEIYILLVLNVCRYVQIVRNINVYDIYKRSIFCTHLIIYLVPAIGVIIEVAAGWAAIRSFSGESCDAIFTNPYIQGFNLTCGYILPILLNIIVIYLNVHHIHLTSRLQRAQHHVSAREKYHRSLVIQFLVFYAVWISLWSPNLIVFQFTSGTSNMAQLFSLLNYIEITLDPIIIAALDVRFQRLWRKIRTYLKNTLFHNQRNQRRIIPIAATPNVLFTSHAHEQVIIATIAR